MKFNNEMEVKEFMDANGGDITQLSDEDVRELYRYESYCHYNGIKQPTLLGFYQAEMSHRHSSSLNQMSIEQARSNNKLARWAIGIGVVSMIGTVVSYADPGRRILQHIFADKDKKIAELEGQLKAKSDELAAKKNEPDGPAHAQPASMEGKPTNDNLKIEEKNK